MLKLPLYYIKQIYLSNLKILWLYFNGVDNWIKCIGRWMNCCHKSFTGKKERKEGQKKGKRRSDLICEQYTKICKLGASWNGQDFTKHTSWLQEFSFLKS